MFNFIPIRGAPPSLLFQNPIPAAIFLLALAIWFSLLIRRANERNNYIGGLFAAPSQRLLAWSSQPSNRARLLDIRFHPVWRHPDCTVMRWYNDQSASSRKFRTIEHRNDIHGPYYSEFLLLKLTDGAICRLERVGEGSRADAILETGCAANDIIQWFDPDHYAEFESKHPSKLISEISFPFEYDIIDVLAVCYSIKNIKEFSVYTLQRYNCYFLCLTVLAILTRRAANWETEIGPGLACELASLLNLSAQEVEKTTISRVRALFDANNPHRPKSRLEGLRSRLGSDNRIPRYVRGGVDSSLWEAFGDSDTLVERFIYLHLCNSVFPPLQSRLATISQNQSAHIVVKALDDSSLPREIMNKTSEFQERYIQRRIRSHAERMGNFRLAPAPLVYADILNAMAAVWKSLPPCLGSEVQVSGRGGPVIHAKT